MDAKAYLELELLEVTEWLPEPEPLSPLENDAWMEREQALRYRLGGGPGLPVSGECAV